MADFDPMILRTRYNRLLAPVGSYDSLILNGKLEKWTNVNTVADNWTIGDSQGGSTWSRYSTTRTGGAGSYAQRIEWPSSSMTIPGSMRQQYVLLGHNQMYARGHLGRTINASVWVKGTGIAGQACSLYIIERDINDNDIGSSYSYFVMTASWQKLTHSRVIDGLATRKFEIHLQFLRFATIALDYLVDDAELYQEYTLARNPSMPDEGEIMVPGRNFSRTIGGTLLRGRPAAVTAKWEKQLHFGLISKTQVEALRSLYLHDSPMEWVPNHPLLPALMEVRWIGDFDFKLISSAAGSNHYGGRAVFSEY